MIGRKTELDEGLERSAGDVLAGRVDHRVVIGEGDVGQEFLVAPLVEGTESAVVVLHREEPVEPAVDRRAPPVLVARARELQTR
jgi:hypothetical protein